jgi:hypothetical protein
MCFYVFQCIWRYLNVSIDIVIGISPPYSHRNVFAMRTHTHICFSLSTMITFLTCFTTIVFYHLFVSIFIQSIKKITYQSLFFKFIHPPTFHIPPSTFHVVIGCVEHSGAQVLISRILYAHSQSFYLDKIASKIDEWNIHVLHKF